MAKTIFKKSAYTGFSKEAKKLLNVVSDCVRAVHLRGVTMTEALKTVRSFAEKNAFELRHGNFDLLRKEFRPEDDLSDEEKVILTQL